MTASWSWSFSFRTLVRSFSTASSAVSMPRSARISVSSNSSKKASSASEKPEKRFVVIFFSLSKKPMVSSQIGNQRRRGLSQSNLFPQYL